MYWIFAFLDITYIFDKVEKYKKMKLKKIPAIDLLLGQTVQNSVFAIK